MKRLLLVLLAGLAVALGWLGRGLVKSVGIRRLAAAVANPAKRHGLDIRIPVDRGGWTRLTLKADLSAPLSEAVGYPVEAAAYSHYGGFNLSRVYSDFMNPDSDYYQAWVGAYVVFDGEGRKHFGFDDDGKPVQQEALDVLEADQRLVLGGAGCPNRFPDGRRVRLIDDMTATEVDTGGQRWWRMDGKAETWSAYHRGNSPDGHWRAGAVYGRVPDDARHPVDDFHPLVYDGSFWLRYFPEWQATCARFYIYPEYADRNGQRVTKGQQLEGECGSIVDRITFAKLSAEQARPG
ncbi:hypothetical protein LCGC14_2697930 [marine sediment metagenome]|uniref:Uncharacterized protein n=1 Tax=marine sediment metagenome TaxID=412755 RepID=A0A0F8ZGS3_9ZZZZ